jgi:glycosyltransferase involved in cell wall biosynthesis
MRRGVGTGAEGKVPAVPMALGVPRPEGVLAALDGADVVVAGDGAAGEAARAGAARVVRWAEEPWDVALPALTPVAAHAALLRALHPGLPVAHVRVGLDPVAAPAAPPAAGAPLRVVAAGGPAEAALAQVREPVTRADDLAAADVVLDLSRRERPPGPSLRGAAHGAVPVVTAAAGREDHVEHGVDGLVVAWDDPRGAARTLDLLARDRALLARLRAGALARAAAQPDVEEADAELAAALERVLAAPRPDPAAQARALARWAQLGAAAPPQDRTPPPPPEERPTRRSRLAERLRRGRAAA